MTPREAPSFEGEATIFDRRDSRIALRFIILIGILSFFADFTYEGSRSIVGPYLATLQATGTIVGIVTGFGELLGYALRLFSGRWADATGRYWPITIFGYALQMASVPALALTESWPAAAALIILERVGKAIRNPPRMLRMLSHAGKQAGLCWAFGLHEALDQFGAMFGPLVVSAVLAHDGSYHEAFAVLLVPAVINLSLVLLARFLLPETAGPRSFATGHGRSQPATVFWIYLLGAILVAAGFADYPLIAFHFTRNGTVPSDWIAIFYAVAMAVSGTGSLVFGRLFDRYGFTVLVILTLISALFAPLVFLGGFWLALVGAAVWGLGMGVHEFNHSCGCFADGGRPPASLGVWDVYRGLWDFLVSRQHGYWILYDTSVAAVIVFCVATQLLAAPIFLFVGRRALLQHPAEYNSGES